MKKKLLVFLMLVFFTTLASAETLENAEALFNYKCNGYYDYKYYHKYDGGVLKFRKFYYEFPYYRYRLSFGDQVRYGKLKRTNVKFLDENYTLVTYKFETVEIDDKTYNFDEMKWDDFKYCFESSRLMWDFFDIFNNTLTILYEPDFTSYWPLSRHEVEHIDNYMNTLFLNERINQPERDINYDEIDAEFYKLYNEVLSGEVDEYFNEYYNE